MREGIDRQDYTDADIIFLEAVKRGLPNAETWFLDFAALYREHDMTSRAIALLERGKELFPQSPLIASKLWQLRHSREPTDFIRAHSCVAISMRCASNFSGVSM